MVLGRGTAGSWPLPLEEMRGAIEQRLPAASLSELTLLRTHSKITIRIDESAWNASEVAAAAWMAAADAVNVYLGKSGGTWEHSKPCRWPSVRNWSDYGI